MMSDKIRCMNEEISGVLFLISTHFLNFTGDISHFFHDVIAAGQNFEWQMVVIPVDERGG